MSDTLPPMTLAGLKEDLANPHYSAYVYIGDEADDGWALALAAQGMIPALRVYRVADRDSAKAVRDEFEVPKTHLAAVFGYGIKVHSTLTRAKAEDYLTMTQAILAARVPGGQ